MLCKTRGLTLHYIKYSDSSVIACVYTEFAGRKSFIINNVRGKNSATSIGLFQPLTILEMDIYYREKKELQRIKEARIITPLQNIPFDIRKNTIALFLAEVLYKTLREEIGNEPLFGFLLNSIQLLDCNTRGTANFHLLFLLELSKYLGFYPLQNYSDENPIFDMLNGKFVSLLPVHPYYLDKTYSLMLNDLMKLSFTTIYSMELNHTQRFELLSKILEYYYLHLEGIGKIKSLEVLKEIF